MAGIIGFSRVTPQLRRNDDDSSAAEAVLH
jgi:hypothetical protein